MNVFILRLALKDILPDTTLKGPAERKRSESGRKITEISQEEIVKRLQAQENNPFHGFVEGNLILKQGTSSYLNSPFFF